MSDTRTVTAEEALQYLKEGNERYMNNRILGQDLTSRIKKTAEGQFPFAAILGCIDSRAIPELIFDQSIGDIFTIRVAGNVISEDVLASLEFSCSLAGAKLIIVKGHTRCGAVKGACDGVHTGHLDHLLSKITPAVRAAKGSEFKSEDELAFRDEVSRINVLNSVREIKERSPLLNNLISSGEVVIKGAMYDVTTGKVEWLNG